MKIKIGDTWYDSDRQPLMVRFSAEEKNLVANMSGENNNFCCFPEGTPTEAVRAFMGDITNETFQVHTLNNGG